MDANMLKNIVDGVSKVVGLMDHANEGELISSDRLGIGGSNSFVSLDQSVVTVAKMGDYMTERFPSNLDVIGSIDEIGEKFYLIDDYIWSNTDVQFKKIISNDIYNSLLTDSDVFSVTGITKSHRYLQAGVDVMVQCNPTQYHMGALLVALVPGWEDGISYASMTMCPHGIINLSINNCVRIKAPYVNTRGSYDTKTNMGAVWRLVVLVLSELRITGATAAEIDVAVFARFTDLKTFGLKPMTMMGPEAVRVAPGANVVNLSIRQEACASMYIGLGRDHAQADASYAGGMKIRNFREWLHTPSYFGRFQMANSQSMGSRIATWRVNPYDYYAKDEDADWHPTHQSAICQKFCYWKADIIYKLQVVRTRFHSGKILVCFFPGNESLDVANIPIQQAANCKSAVFDIAGVSSTLVFRVAYTSDTHYRTNNVVLGDNPQAKLKNHFNSIGKISVYVLSKLRCPVSTPQHVWFNIWISMENVDLMCPMFENIAGHNTVSNTINESRPTGVYTNAGDERAEDGSFATQGEVQQEPQGEIVREAPKDVPTGTATNIEDPALENNFADTFQQRDPGVPWHDVDFLDIYEFMGRGFFFCSFTLNAGDSNGKKMFTIPLDLTRARGQDKGMGGMLQWFYGMCHLFRGPLDLTVVILGDHDVDGMTFFTPPGMYVSTPWDQERPGALTLDYVTSFGAVRWNSRFCNSFQIRIPWCNDCYAISGNCDPTKSTDSMLGYVTTVVNNYKPTTEDRISFSMYLSLPREAELFVHRPVLRYSVVKSSLGTVGYLGYEESSVDIPAPEEPTRPIPAARVLRGAAETSFYRDVRLDVGKVRLEYAHEEHRIAKLTTKSGTLFDDFEMVQFRDRGVLLRGFVHQGKVYYADCPHRPMAQIPVLKTGVLMVADVSSSWLSLNTKFDEYLASIYVGMFEEDIKFNWHKFINGEFEEAFDKDVWLHCDALCEGRFVEVLKIFCGRSIGKLDQVIYGSEVLTDISKTTSDVQKLALDCQKLIDEVSTAIKRISNGFVSKKRYFVTTVVSSIVKCAVRLFIGVRTNWRSDVLVALSIETAFDLAICSFDFVSVLNAMFTEVGVDELKSNSFDVKNAVAAFSLFKNVRECFSWLIGYITKWFDNHYGRTQKRLDFLMENQNVIEAMLNYVDEYCASPVDRQNQYDEGVKLIKELRTLLSVVQGDDELRKAVGDVRGAINLVHHKLRNANVKYQEAGLRAEPTVVFLHGERGAGKSLAAMAIAVKVCKHLGLDPKTQIYCRPGGGDYWDGYAGQYICMIDDIGQCTNDEDWSQFCQMVSCSPYRLNMASLEDKGKHFSSPLIIATSNLSEPDPRTIYDRSAIMRRLHLKIKVCPSDYYKRMVDGIELLDVEKARKDGTLADMSCVKFRLNQDEVPLDFIVQRCLYLTSNKEVLMDEMIQIWSQSGADSFSNWLALNHGNSFRGPKLFQLIKEHKVLLVSCVLGALGLVGTLTLTSVMARKKKPVKTVGAYDGQPVTIKRTVRLGNELESQSMLDLSIVIEKALCKFGVSSDGETVSWRTNAFRVYDQWIIVPRHAFKFDDEVTHYFFLIRNTTYIIDVASVVHVELDRGSDLTFMKVNGVPRAKDLRSHFIKKADVEMCDGVLATLATINKGLYQLITEGAVKHRPSITYTHKKTDGGTVEVTTADVWRGSGDTFPGSCGGVLVSANNKVGNAFLGLHVASGGGVMIAATVYYEDLEKLDRCVANSSRIKSFEIAPETLHSNSRTQFVKSEIHDYLPWPVEKKPSALIYQRGDVDVFQVVLSKYGTPLVEKPFDFDCAVEAYRSDLTAVLGPPSFELLSRQQAIEGIRGMDGLDLSTSPGIPYVFHHKTKRAMITDGKPTDEMLLARLDDHGGCLMSGTKCSVIFESCMKDELRSLSKVAAGDTRVIEGSPVCFTIVMRQILGSVIAKLHLNHGWHTGIAVGIDPDVEWTELYNEAKAFGDFVLAMDYCNFDKHVQPFMIESAIQILCHLGDVPSNYCQSLIETLTVTKHQMGQLRFEVNGCLPSGMCATSIMNSVINNMILYCVFSRTLGVSTFDLRKFVRFVVYGDDCVVLFARDCPTDFPLQRVMDHFSSLGMVVTGADKNVIKFVTLEEMVFLKRSLKLGYSHLVHPCLELKTIHHMLLWRRKNVKLAEMVQNACWFAYHHGPDYYEDFSEVVRNACATAGVAVVIPTYRELDCRFLSLHYSYV